MVDMSIFILLLFEINSFSSSAEGFDCLQKGGGARVGVEDRQELSSRRIRGQRIFHSQNEISRKGLRVHEIQGCAVFHVEKTPSENILSQRT